MHPFEDGTEFGLQDTKHKLDVLQSIYIDGNLFYLRAASYEAILKPSQIMLQIDTWYKGFKQVAKALSKSTLPANPVPNCTSCPESKLKSFSPLRTNIGSSDTAAQIVHM